MGARLAHMRQSVESCPSLREQPTTGGAMFEVGDYFTSPHPTRPSTTASPSEETQDACSDSHSMDGGSLSMTHHATQGGEAEDIQIEDWNRGLPPVSRAPRLVSKKHLAAMGDRPPIKEHMSTSSIEADEVSN